MAGDHVVMRASLDPAHGGAWTEESGWVVVEWGALRLQSLYTALVSRDDARALARIQASLAGRRAWDLTGSVGERLPPAPLVRRAGARSYCVDIVDGDDEHSRCLAALSGDAAQQALEAAGFPSVFGQLLLTHADRA